MEAIQQFDFVTSVDLALSSVKQKTIYHFLYGSQLYGGLFGVFGNFNAIAKPDGSIYFDTIDLKLFNYSGAINIGFTQHEVQYDGQENIYFGVMGTSRQYEKKLKFFAPIVLKRGDRLHLVFNRILYPLPGFEFDVSERNSCDLRKESPAPIPESDFFDSEFQYRSGIDYYSHALKPGMVGFNGLTMDSINRVHPFPSERCSQSNVNLFV
jgi:hypothetical protein